jgi:tRNA-Thr(GGU) m(6)t(6)A37 methyltransferase TsaA
MNEIVYRPIGVIQSPFKTPEDAPIQPRYARQAEGQVVLEDQYAEGLSDLQDFSHIILLYHLHLSESYSLRVTPYLDDQKRGLFATRAPRRPNPIGLSVVRLVAVEGNTLHVKDIDAVDGTPLLDIKPYVREFDPDVEIRVGWLTGRTGPDNEPRRD